MKRFTKILIANRGEIALRVIKTLKKSGIGSVAIYTVDEKHAPYIRYSDESVLLIGDSLADTYLNIEKIVNIGKEKGCDAIHPGYGFLSENPEFARKTIEAGLAFIGPSPEAISLMGNKSNARKLAREFSIPLIEGIEGDVEAIMNQSNKLKFPILVKAASGGGGKAMKIVRKQNDLRHALEDAQREAYNYFGDKRIYVERYFENARHIEIQVLADYFGNIIIPGERECTVQRRYQKVIEEAPSIFLKQEVREKMFSAVTEIVKRITYVNAGTVEFLVDENQDFFFLEMNTRIQVEHPVTEMVSNIDIVAMQLSIAAGNKINLEQNDIQINGHAIEARLYAEDPAKEFEPSPGIISHYIEPQAISGLRIDSGIDGPVKLNPHYDPLLAKVIVHDNDRAGAIKKLHKALRLYTITGISTNREFLTALLENEEFVGNQISTTWLESRRKDILEEINERRTKVDEPAVIASWIIGTIYSPTGYTGINIWRQIGFWRMLLAKSCLYGGRQLDTIVEPISANEIKLKFGKQWLSVIVNYCENGNCGISIDGKYVESRIITGIGSEDIITIDGLDFMVFPLDRLPIQPHLNEMVQELQVNGHLVLKSPMFGRIVKLNVRPASQISKGDLLYTLDAMKIENKVLSPVNAFVKEIKVAEGEQVSLGQTIMLVENESM